LNSSALDLGFGVLVASYSEDGTSVGLFFETGDFVRYRSNEGAVGPIHIGASAPPVLSAGGQFVANAMDLGDGSFEGFVRRIDGGAVLSRQTLQTADLVWDRFGGLLMIQAWSLRRWDPESGEVTQLFPPT